MTDCDSGGDVSQRGGVEESQSERERDGKNAGYGVASAGDVGYFVSLRGQMPGGLMGLEKGHAILTARDEKRRRSDPWQKQVDGVGQVFGGLDRFARGGGGLLQVGRDDGGSLVAREVAGLWIHHDGLAVFHRFRDEPAAE